MITTNLKEMKEELEVTDISLSNKVFDALKAFKMS